MLKHFDMKDCALKMTLMNEKIQLNFIDNNNENLADNSLSEIDKKCYQQAIENLLYLSLEIKSDISLAIVILNQFTANSHEKHKAVLNKVFYYFRNIFDIDIIYYTVKSLISTGFLNVSYVHFIIKKDRCSTSKYIFFMTDKSVS